MTVIHRIELLLSIRISDVQAQQQGRLHCAPPITDAIVWARCCTATRLYNALAHVCARLPLHARVACRIADAASQASRSASEGFVSRVLSPRGAAVPCGAWYHRAAPYGCVPSDSTMAQNRLRQTVRPACSPCQRRLRTRAPPSPPPASSPPPSSSPATHQHAAPVSR